MYIKKFFLFVVIFIITTSCKITQEGLWGVKVDNDEVVKSIFISEDGKEAILLGEKYDYFLTDDEVTPVRRSTVMLKKLFLWEGRNKLKVGSSVRAKGSEVEVNLYFKVDIKSLTKEELKFIKDNEGREFDHNSNFPKMSLPALELKGYRVDAGSKVIDNKFIQTGFIKTNDKTMIFEERTPLKTTSKILLTPFAVAADILMIPLYIVGLGGMIAAE
jgi:hypothetical protein